MLFIPRIIKLYFTVGIAFKDGLCQFNELKRSMDSIAIIKDSGNFERILTATHEIGHMYVNDIS